MKTSKLQIIDTIEGKIVASQKIESNLNVRKLEDVIRNFIEAHNLEDAIQENYEDIADGLWHEEVWSLDDTYALKLV